MAARNQLLGMAATNSDRRSSAARKAWKTRAQLKIDIDQDKATTLGVSLADINTTLTADFGSAYVNNFVDGNRVQQVIVHAGHALPHEQYLRTKRAASA